MSKTLTVKVSDEAFESLALCASAAGMPPESLAGADLEQMYLPIAQANGQASSEDDARRAARLRFETHFGSVDLGRPTGADNVSIDADLAQEYAGHKGA